MAWLTTQEWSDSTVYPNISYQHEIFIYPSFSFTTSTIKETNHRYKVFIITIHLSGLAQHYTTCGFLQELYGIPKQHRLGCIGACLLRLTSKLDKSYVFVKY